MKKAYSGDDTAQLQHMFNRKAAEVTSGEAVCWRMSACEWGTVLIHQKSRHTIDFVIAGGVF